LDARAPCKSHSALARILPQKLSTSTLSKSKLAQFIRFLICLFLYKKHFFKIAKTLDVDRPEDIVSAEKYLLENDYDFKS
jgi:hypothetical protein